MGIDKGKVKSRVEFNNMSSKISENSTIINLNKFIQSFTSSGIIWCPNCQKMVIADIINNEIICSECLLTIGMLKTKVGIKHEEARAKIKVDKIVARLQ